MKRKLTDNLSYKFVALGVALILWVSMLGRKDSTLVKPFELQVLLPTNFEMVSSLPDVVNVEVSGPRVALKKLNRMNTIYTIDLSSAKAGKQVVHLKREGLGLPIGSRVVSIEPDQITVILRDTSPPAK